MLYGDGRSSTQPDPTPDRTERGVVSGPLNGLRVVEFAAIGPVTFAGMVLSDLGADVLRITRPGPRGIDHSLTDPLLRGRTTVELDLKAEDEHERAVTLARCADVLLEGNRPGVMERLRLGPDDLLDRNPRLVYGRMTGFGQDGPLAKRAGHDINYIAVTGVLDAFRREGQMPTFPLNLVGDFGGGGMLLALGVVSAALEAQRSGRGQVVDACMVDGVSLLATMIHGMRADGVWREPAGTNVLDGGAHFYEVYATADERFMAVGAVEPNFYAELLRVLGLGEDDLPQWDQSRWPEFKARLAEVFRTRTRAEWTEAFGSTDACVTPVLTLAETPSAAHSIAREAFIAHGGADMPRPAPRFSVTAARPRDSQSIGPSAAVERWAQSSS
jgi:alpha-methylacyl-CoA racemase